MAKIYDVKVTGQALSQMGEIVDYISHVLCAPEAAYNLLERLEKEITDLSEMPGKFRLIDEEPWKSEGVRKLVVNNFIVYYWIDEENTRVQVFAVIYEKRDQIEQLKNIHL